MAVVEPLAGPLPEPARAERLLDATELAAQPDLLSALKQGLSSLDRELESRFHAGDDISALVRARAWGVERLLLIAWQRLLGTPKDLALVAVGGFGRGQLHPHSDVDLLILSAGRDLAPEHRRAIETFVTLLWDAGFYLGHSVRTVGQCMEEAVADVGTATSLMEARLLTGEESLFQALVESMVPEHLWPADRFFDAKLEEQRRRHEQYGETAYNLEPNIKEGPGGLRDIQTIAWVAQRDFGTDSLHGLVEHGFLTESEYRELLDGQRYLWRVRYALHLLARRAEDRLLFDFQRQAADWFGYREEPGSNRAVERFMQGYYRVVTSLERLNERLLQLFSEQLHGHGDPVIEDLGDGFRLRDGYLDVQDESLFRRRPETLMELFLLLARHERARGVRASTIRLIVDHLYLVDEGFSRDPRVLSLFLELLRQRQGVYTQLQRMNRYGLLARLLPVFGDIVGRMQFDLFHVYTVDQHILFTVRNLRRFAYGKHADTFPRVAEVFQGLQRPELLYLAALFHDIAKGRGGDHSELGAKDAREFCARLPLVEEDRALVAWLVEHHLLMSQTSQKKDIGDPDTVIDFTRVVNTRRRLDHLYLLTVADIAATSPRLWNSWKSGLLWDLYTSARDALERDPGQWLDRQETIEASRDSVRQALVQRGGAWEAEGPRIDALWSGMPPDVFLRFDDSQLAWATEQALTHDAAHALVALRQRAELGVTEVFVYAEDYTGLFATTTAVMDELGLDVLSARVVTTGGQRSFDLFQLMDRHGRTLNEADAQTLAARLAGALDAQSLRRPVKRPLPRRLRAFIQPPRLSFRRVRDGRVTELEVRCSDRPGLLSQLAAAMVASDVAIHDALISTLGDRVEDVFLVTDRNHQPLDEAAQERLAAAIRERLDSDTHSNT